MYTEKADRQYFQRKYPGVAAEVVVNQRIKMASRDAFWRGLFAGAYSAAFLRNVGPRGGAGIAHQTVGQAVAFANFNCFRRWNW